jgi:hypothetical protein
MSGELGFREYSLSISPHKIWKHFADLLMLSALQNPDKSGLPSVVRGAAAFRFGLPSGVRGVPESGIEHHCAAAVPAIAQFNDASATTALPLAGIREIHHRLPSTCFWNYTHDEEIAIVPSRRRLPASKKATASILERLLPLLPIMAVNRTFQQQPG